MIVLQSIHFPESNWLAGQIASNSSESIVGCEFLPRQESDGSFFPARRPRPSGSRDSILSAKTHSRLQQKTCRHLPLLCRYVAWSAQPRLGEERRLSTRGALPLS